MEGEPVGEVREQVLAAIDTFLAHAVDLTALGAPHDCLEIGYAGGDKLYLPVENIELLTPYVVEEFLPGEEGLLGSALALRDLVEHAPRRIDLDRDHVLVAEAGRLGKKIG